MKNNIITSVLFLLFITGFSQNSKYELPARRTPSANKEKLNEAKFINDVSPLLWSNLVLPNNERYYLEQRRINEYPVLETFVYPQEKYKQVIDYVAVEISAICNGKALAAQSTSDKLTTEQKNILTTADLGSDISIKIKFKYKDQKDDNFGSRNKMIEGESLVKVVPQTEAEYPGGFQQLSEYFAGNVINKISEKGAVDKIYQAIVKFTVNEEGQIVDAKISRTSTDPKIDKLLVEAINKMPKWKPAENSGIKVKQEFILPFGEGGC